MFLITGPMFSGKTSKLQDFICKSTNPLVLTNKIDKRYSEEHIVNHKGNKIKAFFCETFEELIILFKKNETKNIFIDEIQFFKKDFIEKIFEAKDKEFLNINIYFSGLNKDFRGNLFETTKILLEKLPKKNIIILKALCETCGNLASFTKLLDKQPQGNILVGYSNYIAVCKDCMKI